MKELSDDEIAPFPAYGVTVAQTSPPSTNGGGSPPRQSRFATLGQDRLAAIRDIIRETRISGE